MNGVQVTNQQNKKSVKFKIKTTAIQVLDFETSQPIEDLIASDIMLEWGGNNQKLLFIKLNKNTERLYYLEPTREELKQLESIQGFEKLLKPLVDHRQNRQLKTWMGPLILVTLLVGLFFMRSSIAQFFSGLVPFSVEKKIADQIFKPKRTVEQKQLLDQLTLLISQLKFKDEKWNKNFSFHISSDTEANAYATIGGHIFINKGLITSVDRAEDLLGVVAHEMIHVEKRHVVKSLVQGLGVFTVLSFLIGDISGVAAVIVDQGAPILNLSYSRELEDEADRLGLELLIENKIDPEGLANSLKAIFDQQKKMISESPGAEVLEKLQKIEILNSHPDIEKRISSLRARSNDLRKNKKVNMINFDYDKFKNAVKEQY